MKKEEILSQLKAAQKIIDQCVVALGATGSSVVVSRRPIVVTTKPMKVDFTLNARNFIKTYGKGLSGQKKFVLLLAYIAKGKIDTNVEAGLVVTLWGKMTAKDLLGYSYNGKYPTAAKDDGWIDSKKYGTYHLRSIWMEIFA